MSTEDFDSRLDAYFSSATNLTKNQWRERLRSLGGEAQGVRQPGSRDAVVPPQRPSSPEIKTGSMQSAPLPSPQPAPAATPTSFVSGIKKWIVVEDGVPKYYNVTAAFDSNV